MKERKVLVKGDDVAILSCPNCGKIKKLNVGHFRQNCKRVLRAKRSCDEIFSICLEYRKDVRKSVKLLGRTVNLSNHNETQDIIIKNISKGGVGFCPFKKHKTKQDDRLLVLFQLNDSNSTSINTDVTVRTVNNDYIGCEFNNIEKIKIPLGFYLLD